MKYFLILAVVMATSLTVGWGANQDANQEVEHAPTVAQCQADQRLWMADLEEADSKQLPTFHVLTKWADEMTDCEKVDPDNKWGYYNTLTEIGAEKRTRLVNFLDRHGLWDKFKQEDEAGKR